MRRIVLSAVAALLAPLALTGCSALGLGSSNKPGAEASKDGKDGGDSWLVSDLGKPTPSPGAGKGGASRPPVLPPVSFLPIVPECAKAWTADPVLIPMAIEPAKGSLKVSWPRQYDSNYRITAVPQPLVSGDQPALVWQDVAPGTSCTVTATIKNLVSGKAYVVWLDAPNTGYHRDGTAHPYAGESGVVRPL